MRIAINGFGRIGRTFLRTVLADEKGFSSLDVAVINIGPQNIADVAYVFKYDSVMGIFPGDISQEGDELFINNKKIKILAVSLLQDIDWKAYSIDWVVEASGKFTTKKDAIVHCQQGAGHVLITAPADDEDCTIIPGVNDAIYDDVRHKIVSLGSCTTNAFLPLLKIVNDAFTIESGSMTTTHSYTNSQVLLDVQTHDRDVRRSRAAALNIIPTNTGATQVLQKVMPSLTHKIMTMALRIPVASVSFLDMTLILKSSIQRGQLEAALNDAVKITMPNIVGLSYEPCVSTDYKGSSYSVIVDGKLLQVEGAMVKICGWYDNEWGYSCRLRDFLLAQSL